MSDKAKQIKEQIKNGTYALDIETTAEKIKVPKLLAPKNKW